MRGYHVYNNVWEAAAGETLLCVREPRNAHDRYAVAIEKDGRIIGHLSREVSRVCALLLKRGGSIRCTVTGRRRYSADLPQGGLEIPCFVVFEGKLKEIEKLKCVLKCITDKLFLMLYLYVSMVIIYYEDYYRNKFWNILIIKLVTSTVLFRISLMFHRVYFCIILILHDPI